MWLQTNIPHHWVGHPSCLPALQLGLQGLQFCLQGLQFAVQESLKNTSFYFQSKYFRSPRLTIWSPRLTTCLQWVEKLTNCKPKAYNDQPWHQHCQENKPTNDYRWRYSPTRIGVRYFKGGVSVAQWIRTLQKRFPHGLKFAEKRLTPLSTQERVGTKNY